MKISKNTISIFRNFSAIHESLVVDSGSSIVSISKERNIIAVYDPPEEFPDFGIFRLSEFLSGVSLFKLDDVDFIFKDKFVQIKYENNSIKYVFTDKDLIEYVDAVKPPEKYKGFDKFNSTFELSEDDIQRIKKSAGILFTGSSFKTDVEIVSKDGSGTIKVQDEDDIMSNNFSVNIETEGDCNITFNVDYLIMLRGDYSVSVLNKKLIKFAHKTLPLIYLISPRVN